MDIIPGVKVTGHEHHFLLSIASLSFPDGTVETTTLRMCQICGLTHSLIMQGGQWYWKMVEEHSHE